MLNMTNAQLHQCVHCSRVGDYDLIIPFTLSLSARTTPSKVPVTTCSSSFHRPEAVKGRKGPVNGRFALACLLWLPEQRTHPHKQRTIQLNYFSPQCHIRPSPNPPPRMMSIALITLLPRMFSLHGTILNKRVKR